MSLIFDGMLVAMRDIQRSIVMLLVMLLVVLIGLLACKQTGSRAPREKVVLDEFKILKDGDQWNLGASSSITLKVTELL